MIRSFAQTMVSEHTRLMAQRAPMLRTSGDPSGTTALTGPLSQMLETLKNAPAAGFAAAYKRGQIAAHEEALKVHGTYAAKGTDPALRAMATRVVTMLQRHLDKARRLPEA